MGARFWEAPAVEVDGQGRTTAHARALHGEVVMHPTGRRLAYGWVALPQQPTPMDLLSAQHRLQGKLVQQFVGQRSGDAP